MKTLKDFIIENKSGDSSLHDWFTKSKSSDGKPGWVQLGGRYAGKSCAKQPGQTTKPKCGSSKMAANMSDKEEDAAARRKRAKDPNPNRKGKAINVATEEVVNEDACTTKVKSRYSVWPSAYASGALVRCRKVGAKNWGNKTKKEETELISFKTFVYECWTGYKAAGVKKKNGKMVPEEVELEEEFKKGDRVRHKDGTLGTVTREPDEQGIVSWKYAGNNHRVSHKSALKSADGEKFRWRQNKEEVEQIDEMDKSQPSSSRGGEGLPLGKEAFPAKANKVKSDALKSLQKQYKKVNKKVKEEVEQIEEVAAWQRKEGKNPEGGLNQKGVDSYRREHPGSKLKTAVTTKPSKLKPGSKAANRRKSFCARMSGMKKRLTSAKTANDPDSRINKSLRKWNC